MPLSVTGLKAAADVTLTATVGMDMVSGHVRVLDGNEVPQLVSLTPVMASVAPGGMLSMTVTLDLPAPKGGLAVMLSAGSGMVPMTVAVPEDQVSASFAYVQAGMGGMDTVTAKLGNVVLTSMISVVSHLVINEVDYDQIGGDTTEFIEIHNPSMVPVDASRYALVLVNGSNNTEYLRVPLMGMIPATSYLVVGSKTLMVPMGVLKIDFANMQDNVQNGPPDGVALVDVMDNKVIDALSYEGSITMAKINNIANPVNLVEGKATAVEDSNVAPGSLSRLPNGKDTDNADSDWKFSMTPTPGGPNM